MESGQESKDFNMEGDFDGEDREAEEKEGEDGEKEELD